MKYKDFGFRSIYHKFCIFNLKEKMYDILSEYPNIDDCNCFLTYGYIDKEKGVSVEVLGGVIRNSGEYEFFEPNNDIRINFPITSLEKDEYEIIDDSKELRDKYAYKLDSLFEYDEDLRLSREMRFLDENRDRIYPDHIMVGIYKDGKVIDNCWVCITTLVENGFKGTIVSESNRNDEIFFRVIEDKNEGTLCICELNI